MSVFVSVVPLAFLVLIEVYFDVFNKVYFTYKNSLYYDLHFVPKRRHFSLLISFSLHRHPRLS